MIGPTATPIILAAGASRRMGSPKALLDIRGRPALAVLIETCRRAGCLDPVVVLGADAARILRSAGDAARATGARIVVHEGWESGRTSSLKAGLRAEPGTSEKAAFLICPVDCPLVGAATIATMLVALASVPAGSPVRIVVPAHAGRRGHPVLCDGSLAGEFLALGDDEPAHQVIRRDPARSLVLPVDDLAVLDDLDTPEAAARALERWDAGRG